MNEIKLIEVNSELGAGTRGASLGVAGMKVAANNVQSRYFAKYDTTQVETENDLLLEEVTTPHAKRIDGVVRVYDRVCSAVSDTLEAGTQFPIVLAGDHSTAGGTIAGIKKAFPDKRLGVIWIDAHADLHTPYTTPSGNIHGMPLACSLNQDNLDKKVNELDDATVKLWDTLKNTGGMAPKIKAHDLVFVGVRSTEDGENHLLDKYNMLEISVAEIKRRGTDSVALDALNYLEECDMIYVSFDVDSMDPTISRGTGTPVPNGISAQEAGTLINRLLDNSKVCCFEIVEVNPTLDDKCNKMAETAFSILERATEVLSHRK
jgi:arginase